MIWSLWLAFGVAETSALKNIGFAKYGPTPALGASGPGGASTPTSGESTAASLP